MHKCEWEQIDTPINGPQSGWYQCQDKDCQRIGYAKTYALGGVRRRDSKRKLPKIYPYICSHYRCTKKAMKSLKTQNGRLIWACQKHKDCSVTEILSRLKSS